MVPSDHGHVLATVHQATPEIVKEAIAVSQEARKEWGTMDAVHRTMVFRKAADLVAGKYRYDIMAATMLGQQTVWQAEIDSTVETIDFLRLNSATYMEEIYAVQLLNSLSVESSGIRNWKVSFSPCHARFTAIGANLVAAPAANTATLGALEAFSKRYSIK